ncbi:hypothetical protein NW755_004271 [Fusarium falciforme]|uniref:Uncharacterized protein n=1 Tax=Fusarium falciforme TaxID=195108 RepID=A0A9W8RC92_9HYPO|nr:hypothetical protein NW755_004271 [Fusarium falciforme]
MEPFTEEEKRLLLAEIIKNSQLDVKILGRFIKSNRIEPNWMRMQLPGGRPMVDCMRAVDGLDIKPRGRKRKVTYKEEPDSQSGKEAASTTNRAAAEEEERSPIICSLPRSHDESNPDSCNRQTALPLAQFSPKYIAKFPIKGLFHPQAKSLMSNSQMSGQPQHLTILLFLPTHAQLWLVEMREDSSLGLKTASRAP